MGNRTTLRCRWRLWRLPITILQRCPTRSKHWGDAKGERSSFIINLNVFAHIHQQVCSEASSRPDEQQFVPITIKKSLRLIINIKLLSFKVVCEDNQRPMIPPHWHEKDVLHKMTQLMKDCWYKMPASRLTALRIKKTIGCINSDEKNGYIMWMRMVQESEESGNMLLNWSPPVLRVASEQWNSFFWYKHFRWLLLRSVCSVCNIVCWESAEKWNEEKSISFRLRTL